MGNQDLIWVFLATMGILILAIFFRELLREWQHERRFDRELRLRGIEKQELREKNESESLKEQIENDRWERYKKEKKEEEESIRKQAGGGTEGYIVIDLSDETRSLFQDLLKGFEEYARLKGYSVSFSSDTTFHDRIAFKFTLTNPDIVIGNDRIRKDLKEYIQKISTEDNDNFLEELPQVISLEEHDLVVTLLKNRINFLRCNYNLTKISTDFYEKFFRNISSIPFQPAQNIIVQTNGSSYNTSSYLAQNSPQALLGTNNAAKQSIKLPTNDREREDQLRHLSDMIDTLKTKETGSVDRNNMIQYFMNIKEELEHNKQLEPSRISEWLERVKQVLQFGSFAQETLLAAKELLSTFGIK